MISPFKHSPLLRRSASWQPTHLLQISHAQGWPHSQQTQFPTLTKSVGFVTRGVDAGGGRTTIMAGTAPTALRGPTGVVIGVTVAGTAGKQKT